MTMFRQYPKLKEVFATSASLFNFSYPHAQTYSYQTIETMLYNHFKNYGISAISDEDVIEWKEDFEARMNEIMPQFNKWYDTWDSISNPLRTVDIHQDIVTQRDVTDTGTVGNIGASGSTTTNNLQERDDYIAEDVQTNDLEKHNEYSDDGSSSHANSEYNNGNVESEKKFSDTPQGSVQNIDNGYLTNYTKDGQATNSSSVGSANDQDHKEGENTQTDTGTITNHKESTDVRANTGTVQVQGTNSNTMTNNLKRDDDSNGDIDKLGYEGTAVAELMDKYRRGIDDYNSKLINAISDFFIMIYE